MPRYAPPGVPITNRPSGLWLPGDSFQANTISNLELWYDGADVASMAATGGLVDQINDKSGNARHATGTTTSRPTLTTNLRNGRSGLVLDGGDVLTLASLTLAQPLTLVVACRLTTAGATNRYAAGPSGGPFIQQQATGGVWAMFGGSQLNSAVATNTLGHVVTAVFNGASSSLRLDGVEIASGNAGTTGYSTGFRIGSGSGVNFWLGHIYEVALYSAAMSAPNLAKIEPGWKQKWATV